MATLFKRKNKKKQPAVKQKKDKKLKASEWILLGILFVGISESLIKHYSLSWRFLPYTLAIFAVLIGKLLLYILKLLTKLANYLLFGIKNLSF